MRAAAFASCPQGLRVSTLAKQARRERVRIGRYQHGMRRVAAVAAPEAPQQGRNRPQKVNATPPLPSPAAIYILTL